MKFYVEQAVKDIGVNVLGAVVENINNHDNSEAYAQWRADTVSALVKEYENVDIKADPVIEAFYALHARVNVSRRKNPPASETLIKLLQKKGDLPHINPAVDIYNLLSVETKLALGAHDIHKLGDSITLRFCDGSERFLPLGADEPKPVKAGEYSYCDNENEVVCWLEIKQVEKDKVTQDSTDIFYIIQGNSQTSDAELESCAEKIIALTTGFCGGQGYLLKPQIL